MALLSKSDLLNEIRSALAAAGWRCLQHGSGQNHPFRLTAFQNGEVRRLIVYIWNVTPGGRVSLPDEFRIQMTGVPSPLEVEPDTITLLLGWHGVTRTFAAWDPDRHRHFTTGSPSVQIGLGALQQARQLGISFWDKETGEVSIGLRPSLLMLYATHQRELHDLAQDANALALVERAISAPAESVPAAQRGTPRGRTAYQIQTWQRSADFRDRVLSAYARQCAVCGQQLDMTVAAHIVPVSEPGSTDETCNGMALCPDHHISYDVGLVGVLPDYQIVVNDDRVAWLQAENWDGGIDRFRDRLRDQIVLPTEDTDRPRRDYLGAGLHLRGWAL